MYKLLVISGLIFSLNGGASEIKKFNQDMISNIQKDVSIDEEKYRNRSPASSGAIEVIEASENDSKVDTNEQTVQGKNLFIPDRW